MSNTNDMTRRTMLAGTLAAAAATAPSYAGTASATPGIPAKLPPFVPLETIRTELVMNLIVTCSAPAKMSPAGGTNSKDGQRDLFFPIIGGYFYGPNIRGIVTPGGADYPVIRPDGMVSLDAFYRLQTDDGTSILIHNTGVVMPIGSPNPKPIRLTPKFTTVAGPHQWLNEGTFIATFFYGDTLPAEYKITNKPGETDRLIQVYRLG